MPAMASGLRFLWFVDDMKTTRGFAPVVLLMVSDGDFDAGAGVPGA